MEEIIRDTEPERIQSAFINGPFDETLKTLKKNNYRLISLEENAKLRMQEGRNAYCSKTGNWVQEDFVYVPGRGVYLSKNSPICENPDKATNCDRSGNKFYLTDEQIGKSFTNSVLLSRNAKDFKIPTKEFKNNKITIYAFGNSAEDYGLFLREAGIKEMPIWFTDLEDKAFAEKVHFWNLSLDTESALSSNLSLTYDKSRGIYEAPKGLSQTQNFSESYTKKDLEILKQVRKGNLAPKNLEKIINRFQ